MRPGATTHRTSDDRGQVLPGLMLLMVVVLAGGIALFQVGRATAMRAEAVTAADAGALAAARNVSEQLLEQVMRSGTYDPHLVDVGRVRSAAVTWANRNGGRVTSVRYEPADLAVRVTVDGQEQLARRPGGREEPDGMSGRLNRSLRNRGATNAAARARARVDVTWAIGPGLGIGGGGGGGGGAGLTEAQLAELSAAAGVPVRPDSALRRYGAACGGGSVDIAHLIDPVKIAILRAEDAMGTGLLVNSAYRTVRCQAAITNPVGGRLAAPGRSLHNHGQAIDTNMVAQLNAAIASRDDIELCQPFPGDDYVHFSWSRGRECAGRRGPLGAGGAFGGDVSSFVSFAVRLTRW